MHPITQYYFKKQANMVYGPQNMDFGQQAPEISPDMINEFAFEEPLYGPKERFTFDDNDAIVSNIKNFSSRNRFDEDPDLSEEALRIVAENPAALGVVGGLGASGLGILNVLRKARKARRGLVFPFGR